ncbi:MAG TPA: HAMP domain-containing sensor histidine kinase [Actinomycetes bacterium]
MSLRSRLVVGLVALSAIGLFVAAVATYGLVGKFLVGRTDQQLVDARGPMLRTLTGEILGAETGTGRPINRTLLPQAYGEIRVDGQVIAVQQSTTLAGDQAAAPALDPLPARRLSTVGSVGGGEPRYRVLVEPLGAGRTLVVALPLTDIQQTLARLARIELFVALAVLTALAGLGWWVVRLGLAPLYRMEATADAIADGDLTRRVDTPDPRTEVGRLGLALNTMLGRIETAFAEKSASEERMRRFLADASHELRTPLTSIRGYSELFRRGADTRPDDLARAMSRIESESERMGVLVEELLTLARLDEGRIAERAPVDLAALAAQAAGDLSVAEPGRPVTVAAPAPVVVDGDEHQLRQVLGNLLANARVHTPAGTPVVVRVGTDGASDTASGAGAAGTAVLEVADRGPGIPAEDQPRVFERFYRVDPARTRASGGVGLGLAIVESVCTAHGGTVTAQENPGGGALFRVRLPLSKTPEDGRPSQRTPSADPQTSQPRPAPSTS